eukprot:TRINITY_DN2028_c0_g1_i1.p1 TRINITY_DN2028_c0_g1~~TRINITY_DN2028_c0_g1_i1.p1  ORF type:complete len:548 (-),score=100.56 TRINITY_DN2028_c0_g1_i1:68-1711(-)
MGNTPTSQTEETPDNDLDSTGNQQEQQEPTTYHCECGYYSLQPEGLMFHKESTSPFGRCPKLVMDHVTGWSSHMIETVPYAKQAQGLVISKGKPNGLFCVVTLTNDWEVSAVTEALSQVPHDTDELNKTHSGDLLSAIGVENAVWRVFDPNPPRGLISFPEKRAKDSGKVLFPGGTSGSLILFTKATRVDLCYELGKRLVSRLGPFVSHVDRTNTFAYLPTTGFSPNLGKDLTGFIDGTRNPDHLLRALVDQVLIFPSDQNQNHISGCYMYAGKFIHDLKSFNALSKEQKFNVVGREYGKEQAHKGYDSRPENPRLDQQEYRSNHVRDAQPSDTRFHTNRAHGAIYRQSMPYVQGPDEGLFFVAFTRYIEELDNAINRMCGHYQADGSTDAILEITRAVTSGYYYVPSLNELSILPKATRLDAPSKEEVPSEPKGENQLTVVFEYCTNCGYKTIFLEKKKVIESLVPGVKWVINPKMPRLASFEIYLEDGTVIWSKLAQPNGMNNYPECFPTNAHVAKRIREILKLPELTTPYDHHEAEQWGQSHWK